jgi:hypothetical protein
VHGPQALTRPPRTPPTDSLYPLCGCHFLSGVRSNNDHSSGRDRHSSCGHSQDRGGSGFQPPEKRARRREGARSRRKDEKGPQRGAQAERRRRVAPGKRRVRDTEPTTLLVEPGRVVRTPLSCYPHLAHTKHLSTGRSELACGTNTETQLYSSTWLRTTGLRVTVVFGVIHQHLAPTTLKQSDHYFVLLLPRAKLDGKVRVAVQQLVFVTCNASTEG